MRTAALLAAGLVVQLGCASSTITLMDSRGQPVTVEQGFGGRGCIAADQNPDGTISVIVQQDGTSDWSGVRGVVSIIPTAVTAALVAILPAGLTLPGISASTEMAAPSPYQGCAGLFEDSNPAKPTTETPAPDAGNKETQ